MFTYLQADEQIDKTNGKNMRFAQLLRGSRWGLSGSPAVEQRLGFLAELLEAETIGGVQLVSAAD